MPEAFESGSAPALVVCLCAQWCGTCRDYQPVLEQMRARFPRARFVWLDVEDESELVDPVEVEDFPTLLIALGGKARFFGPLTPQPETLERMLQASLAPDAPALPANSEAQQLLKRIAAAPLAG
jgi:thiol-disulfide isomerase/thioredoxin